MYDMGFYTCLADAMMHWALPRATAKLIRCRSQAPSLISPVSEAILRPWSFRNVRVVFPRTPHVSTQVCANTFGLDSSLAGFELFPKFDGRQLCSPLT